MAWVLLCSTFTTSAGCGQWIQSDTAVMCTVSQDVFASEQQFRCNQNSEENLLNTAYHLHTEPTNSMQLCHTPQGTWRICKLKAKASSSELFLTKPFPIALSDLKFFSSLLKALQTILQKIYCPTSYIVNLINLKEVKGNYPPNLYSKPSLS